MTLHQRKSNRRRVPGDGCNGLTSRCQYKFYAVANWTVVAHCNIHRPLTHLHPLQFFWGKLSQEYKDGSDGSDELFATRYNMCKILLAAACCDPYNDDFVMQEKDEEDDSLDILSIPAPPLLYFTKEMWKALIKLLNKILKDIKGNENDRTFKGIVGLRRAIHAQIALADFRVILELYANQGENKSETAELRGQLRDAAAALLYVNSNC